MVTVVFYIEHTDTDQKMFYCFKTFSNLKFFHSSNQSRPRWVKLPCEKLSAISAPLLVITDRPPPVWLWTNYFPLNTSALLASHYSVKSSKLMNGHVDYALKAVWRVLQNCCGHPPALWQRVDRLLRFTLQLYYKKKKKKHQRPASKLWKTFHRGDSEPASMIYTYVTFKSRHREVPLAEGDKIYFQSNLLRADRMKLLQPGCKDHAWSGADRRDASYAVCLCKSLINHQSHAETINLFPPDNY